MHASVYNKILEENFKEYVIIFCLNVVLQRIWISTVKVMLNKNTLGVKKVRGQSEAALQIGMCDQKL